MSVKLSERVLRRRAEALVIALVGSANALPWWHSSNQAFEGDTPEARWEKNPHSVYEYLMQYALG